ncbi:DUF3761 domain-containing protein [Candidatus Parcubacteria bacterium]|nr:DUF3761 domain-containing protein [Candidatus Parcubacteria bacterium]
MKKLFFLSLFILLLSGCADLDAPQTYDVWTVPETVEKLVEVETPTETEVNNPALELEKVLDGIIEIPKIEAQKAVEPKTEIKTPVKKETGNVPLSNDNYYTNVDGNKVHSPAYAPSRPADASARCRDGTYSFSQNRRGTCSRHGGVAAWY